MRQSIFILLTLPIYLTCQAININGTYINKYGEKIVISDSLFIYIVKQSHLPIWYNDTLAVCNVKLINSSLLEINSLDNFEEQDKSIEISYSNTYSKGDSTRICFKCPLPMKELRLSVKTEFGVFFNTNEENYIYVPRESKQYVFSAWKEPVTTHTVIGQALGIIRYDSRLFYIHGDGDIQLKIPFLDRQFFERYCVTGEYLYLKRNKMYWKGNIYKKAK